MPYVSRCAIFWLSRVIIILLLSHILAPFGRAEEVRIDDEVIRQWKAYEDFARSLQVKRKVTTSWASGKVERYKIIQKQNRECVLTCNHQVDKPFEQCVIANPWYAARIKRSTSNPSEVSLSDFSDDPKADLSGTAGSIFALALPGFSPHFYVGQTPLSQCVAHPDYQINKITKRAEKDRQLFELDLTYALVNPKIGTTKGQEQLVLDPSRCWCIIRKKGVYTITQRGERLADNESEIEYEMFDHPSGFPLVKSTTTHGKSHLYGNRKEPIKSYTRKAEYEWEVNDHVLNEEFTLSAFGLPEPTGLKLPTKPHLWVYLIGAVVASIALAILFARLKRRRATVTQTKTKPSPVRGLL